MVAIDSDFFDSLVNGPKAAGHLSAISVRKRVRKRDEVFLFRDHVVGHSAVTLPSVCTPVLLARAGDHIAAPAIVTDATTRDVINNHSIAHAKTAAARPGLYNLTARLMTGNYSLIALGALAQVLVIDTAYVRTTNRG